RLRTRHLSGDVLGAGANHRDLHPVVGGIVRWAVRINGASNDGYTVLVPFHAEVAVQVGVDILIVDDVPELCELYAGPAGDVGAATERCRLQLPRLSVRGKTDRVVHERVRIGFLLVLSKGLDTYDDREADDHDTEHKKEELLLTHC